MSDIPNLLTSWPWPLIPPGAEVIEFAYDWVANCTHQMWFCRRGCRRHSDTGLPQSGDVQSRLETLMMNVMFQGTYSDKYKTVLESTRRWIFDDTFKMETLWYTCPMPEPNAGIGYVAFTVELEKKIFAANAYGPLPMGATRLFMPVVRPPQPASGSRAAPQTPEKLSPTPPLKKAKLTPEQLKLIDRNRHIAHQLKIAKQMREANAAAADEQKKIEAMQWLL